MLLLLSLSISSCTTPQRNVASVPSSPSFLNSPSFDQGLLKSSGIILTALRSVHFNDEICVSYLRDFDKALNKLGPSDISPAELEDDSLAVVDVLWEIRLALHSKISESLENECVEEIAHSSRLIRYLQDYLAQRKFKIPAVEASKIHFKNQMMPILTHSPDYFLLQTLEMKRFHDFKTGDILLTRGTGFVGKSNFDGIGFVSLEKRSRKIFVLESSKDHDWKLLPLKDVLKSGNVRIVHLRAKDRSLALSATVSLNRMEAPYGPVPDASRFETDSRFEFLEEWRDLRLTQDSRMRDAIDFKMQLWKTQDHLEIKNEHKLNQIGVQLLKELRSKNRKFEDKKGWAMSYQNLNEALESLKKLIFVKAFK